MWTLAAYYEVKVSDLLLYNNLAENALISVGDKIIIQPGKDWVPPPTPTPAYSVFVQKGQSLWSIAAIHNIPLADILLFNGKDPDAFVSVGDEIKIRLRPGEQPPTPTPTATPVQRYTIRSGDSAWAVSARFGIALDELLAWNNLPQDPLLSVGQELWVQQPVAADAKQPALAADVEQTISPETATPEPTLLTAQTSIQPTGQIPADSATPPPAPTAISTQIIPIEIADLADAADAETEMEVVQISDRPEAILNLPLILGILALIFLGFGGWLLVQSKKV